MKIDDLDDELDIFDDNHTAENSLEINEWVFPIIGYKFGNNILSEYGTGFFVNNEGYFITAGHVLQNNDLYFKAQIDGQLIDFEIVHIEYISKNEQRPPICKDFAICKMNFNSKFNCKLIQTYLEDGKISISGCTVKPVSKLTISPIKNGDFYISMVKIKNEKLNSPRKLPEKELDYRPICKNTMSLILPEEIHYDGMSGGPVYRANNIYGMFIGIEYIQTEYIIEKLNQFKIPFNQ
jgi:hypothetical protein